MTVKWKRHTHGSGGFANLGHGLTLGVNYEALERLPLDAPHYNIRVFGEHIPGRSPSYEEACERAETIAKDWLQEALAKIVAEASRG